MKKDFKKKIIKNLYPIFVIFAFVFLIIYRQYSLKKRTECHKIIQGKVIGYSPSARTMQGLKIEFYINNKKYTNFFDRHVKLPYGTIVPLLYSCSDPNFNQLLLIPKDFNEYGLQYPDSLKWLEKYIRKHKEKNFWE